LVTCFFTTSMLIFTIGEERVIIIPATTQTEIAQVPQEPDDHIANLLMSRGIATIILDEIEPKQIIAALATCKQLGS
jgi:hypothetical protein